MPLTIAQSRLQGERYPGLHDREDWILLPVSQTRDSDAVEASNFRVLLRHLGGESDTLEIHRWRHWAVGWIELAILHPSRADEVAPWERRLESYALLDDMDYYELLDERGETEEE